MNGLENLIEHIKSGAVAECSGIAQEASNECTRIHDEYAQKEQDEYWARVRAGAKDTELRLEQLKTLAGQEANKQILATQQEMVGAAFALAAKKLRELPESDYSAILARLGAGAAADGKVAAALIAKYKEELSPSITSALFE